MDSYKKVAGCFLRRGFFVCALMFAALPARAASVSFFLDQSNKLPDNVNYLSVTLTENGAGGVGILVQYDKTLDPLNSIESDHFGIQKFSFGLSNGVFEEITDLPDGWKIKHNKRMDGFGRFDFQLQGKGWARRDELSFTVAGVNLGNFDPLFAAHVAGFEWCKADDWRTDDWRRYRCGGKDCTTSAFFAGSMSSAPAHVPLPATVWLFGSGLIGLAAVARRKKLGKVGGTRYDMQGNASNIFKKWFEVQAMEDKS